MPEIPDLEAIAGFLRERLPERTLERTDVRFPWLVRTGAGGLEDLHGHRFVDIRRYGKFLLFTTDDERVLVVNPMLTGRFQWAEAGEKQRPMTALTFGFDGGHELRYSDQRRMGRWYLVGVDDLASVPQFAELGPDALTIGEDEFVARVRSRRGQIKNVLTNQQFLAGIGNAYSDEILWQAQIHPHRKRQELSEEQLHALYRAMCEVYAWAAPILREQVAEGLYQRNEEWRDHLRVHRKEGEPCPRCGEPVKSQVTGGRETNYCLRCQPLHAA